MDTFAPIIKRALVETVADIGQLSRDELRELKKAVRKGWLSKGRGGPFPMLKTVYARPGFDFAKNRAEWVAYAMELARLDEIARRLRPTV